MTVSNVLKLLSVTCVVNITSTKASCEINRADIYSNDSYSTFSYHQGSFSVKDIE